MKTTKKLLAGLFALTVCVGFASCGSGDKDKDDKNSASTIEMKDEDFTLGYQPRRRSGSTS